MTADAEILDVVLLEVPVALQARAEERHEELLREFAHVANAGREADIPKRLLALVAELRAQYAPFTGPMRAQILAARAEGWDSVDLRIRLPVSGRSAAREFLHRLEEADAFCRSGDLLTLAAPPELVRFRRWLFAELERQLAGGDPIPWGAYAEGPDDVHPEQG